MKKADRSILIVLSFFLIGIVGMAWIVMMPSDLNVQLKKDYNFLVLAYFFYAYFLWNVFVKHPIDLFEPMAFVSAMYFALLIFAPLVCIIRGTTLILGANTMSGCIKGTTVFLISFLFFCIGYYKKFSFIKPRFRKVNRGRKQENNGAIDECQLMLLFWMVCLLLTVVYDMSTGKSPLYVLTFGQAGAVAQEQSDSSLQILINFSYSLLGAWLYLWKAWQGHNITKIIMYLITLSVFATRGFRFILVIALFAPIVLHYLTVKKRPNLLKVIVACVVILSLMGSFGSIRNNLRTGTQITEVSTGIDALWDVFDSDFCTFKAYYGVVKAFPEKMNYMHGREMFLYTAVMMIPRALWRGKPYPLTHEVATAAMNSVAAKSGMAFPNIGEFYFEFGAIGVVVCMFVFGILCAKLKRMLEKANNLESMIIYSVTFLSLVQIIGRGYIPSNFYLLIFLNLPMFLLNLNGHSRI